MYVIGGGRRDEGSGDDIEQDLEQVIFLCKGDAYLIGLGGSFLCFEYVNTGPAVIAGLDRVIDGPTFSFAADRQRAEEQALAAAPSLFLPTKRGERGKKENPTPTKAEGKRAGVRAKTYSGSGRLAIVQKIRLSRIFFWTGSEARATNR